jgi:hypothetical protein
VFVPSLDLPAPTDMMSDSKPVEIIVQSHRPLLEMEWEQLEELVGGLTAPRRDGELPTEANAMDSKAEGGKDRTVIICMFSASRLMADMIQLAYCPHL